MSNGICQTCGDEHPPLKQSAQKVARCHCRGKLAFDATKFPNREPAERGILMCEPMVLATLADAKTQTRRNVDPQPVMCVPTSVPMIFGRTVQWRSVPNAAQYDRLAAEAWRFGGPVHDEARFKHGKVGDLLYVKETHYYDIPGAMPKVRPANFPMDFYYRADGECCQQIPECECGTVGKPKWRPSIFLPKWAARIWLEITQIREERLQDISAQDAIAEGIKEVLCAGGCRGWKDYSGGSGCFEDPRNSYRSLWESINGVGTWAANPWVWVVTFKRIEKP